MNTPLPLLDRPLVGAGMLVCFFAMSLCLSAGRVLLSTKSQDNAKVSLLLLSRNQLVLFLLPILLVGLLAYSYFVASNVALSVIVPHGLLLLFYVAMAAILMMAKYALHVTISEIFFGQSVHTKWIMSYYNIQMLMGAALFVLILVINYLHLGISTALTVMLIFVVLYKIVLLWRTFAIFFSGFDVFLHILLYFCALEIVPSILMWHFALWINDILVLNF